MIKYHLFFRLNCAILNESFVLTPSKDLDLGNTPCSNQKKESDENDKNVLNHDKDTDSGVHTSDSEGIKKANECQPNDDGVIKKSFRPIKSRTQLFPTNSVLEELSIPSVFQKANHRHAKDSIKISQSAAKPVHRALVASESTEPSTTTQLETPFKKGDEPVFATPSVRQQPFSIAATRMKFPPYSMTCERNDKPQAKILFTTPIARPPPGSLMESNPMRKPLQMSHQKLSPIKEPSSEKEKNEKILTINNIDYIIKQKIGSGGSSQVYLACGKNTGKECAIKLVHLDGDQQVIDGYLNETKLLAKLQGNINVVSLFDYCHLPDRNTLYMVMERGDSDLHKILAGYNNHLPLYTLVSYWYQMLQAVNYIHQNGVIHSDLKPANFLMIGGRLKLIDFGIASNIALDSTSIIKFSQAGTFNYISPEALIDTSTGDSPSTHHQPKIRLSTKSDVSSSISLTLKFSETNLFNYSKKKKIVIFIEFYCDSFFSFLPGLVTRLHSLPTSLQENTIRSHQSPPSEDSHAHQSQHDH